MALFREQLPDYLDAPFLIACHRVAALVVERPEEQAMATTMNEIVNPGLTADTLTGSPVRWTSR